MQENASGEINPRELRVSDAEREHVVSVLNKAIGHGMLTLDEFTARADTALAAKTRAELNAVLVDLPGLAHPESGRPREPAPEEPVRFRATMSKLRRDGHWVVPRALRIENRLGSTSLDFSEAQIDHPEVHISVQISGGSVDLLVPEHATVVTTDVLAAGGKVRNRVGGRSEAGTPRFVLAGTVAAGSLTVRRATYVRIGNLVIRSPWKIGWSTAGG